MNQPQHLTLCADDFGLNPQVCTGILTLAAMGRLTAVSCMTNLPDFAAYADKLLAFKDHIQLGLHFNLTQGPLITKALPCFSLKELLIKTHLRLINAELIAQELDAQLKAFIQVMGCLPRFIDGHQHIHQFPVIRKILLKRYEQELRAAKVAIRSTYPVVDSKSYALKKYVLAYSGGRSLSRQLKKLGIPHNAYFAGIYDFNPKANYPDLFAQWIKASPPNTLIMCHPAKGRHSEDEIAQCREEELHFFMSDAFKEVLSGHNP